MRFFSQNVKVNFIGFTKIFEIFVFFAANWSHGHESAQPDSGNFLQCAGKFICLLGQNARFVFFSANPPKYPASKPKATPITVEISVAMIPTSNEIRVAYRSLLNTSLPI